MILNCKYFMMVAALSGLVFETYAVKDPFMPRKTSTSSEATTTAPGGIVLGPAPAPALDSSSEAIPGLTHDATLNILGRHADAETRAKFAQTSKAGRKTVKETRDIYGSQLNEQKKEVIPVGANLISALVSGSYI